GTRIDAARLLLASGRRPRLGRGRPHPLRVQTTPGGGRPPAPPRGGGGARGLRVRGWAAGDGPGTTHPHASHYQAGVVAANILGRDREADYSAIPRCVFTTPSVFAVGTIPGATDAESAAADPASPDPKPDPSPDPSPDHGPGNGAKVRRMLRIARV